MHKIVLSLLIFCEISVHAMFQITQNRSIAYKKEGHGRTTIYDIPNELIFCHMFVQNQDLNKIATLIKKFKSKKAVNHVLIKSILKNILPLINLSQTNKYFYEILDLNQEIERRLSLSHVSTNTISTYLSDSGGFKDKVFSLNFNNYDLSLHIFLHRKKLNTDHLQVYDKKLYIKLYTFCEKIIKQYNNPELKDACKKLQKECKIMNNFSGACITSVDRLLEEQWEKEYDEDDRLNVLQFRQFGYYYTKLICQTTLELHIFSDKNESIKNIKAAFLDNQSLISILIKNIIIPENVLKYVVVYELFLKTLPPLQLIESSDNNLIFSTPCGFSNEPTIPVNIICNKDFKIKDK
ncbi:MAG TPA: hypothetical protein VL201_00330 [Patescibacteria group bacterium]|jgi:hypothetical protein|nr:hypothetical protein [Patescibacteria group bacterium]